MGFSESKSSRPSEPETTQPPVTTSSKSISSARTSSARGKSTTSSTTTSSKAPSTPLKAQDDITFQICLMGSSGVGKTSLIRRWSERKWDASVESTTEIDFLHKSIVVEGTQVGLHIWDCPGGERNTVPGSYYKGASALLGVYDVNNVDSLKVLSEWFEDASRYAGNDVVKVLIGNKKEGSSQVPSSTASTMAKENGITTTFEVSAKEGGNVEKVFEELAKIINKAVLAMDK